MLALFQGSRLDAEFDAEIVSRGVSGRGDGAPRHSASSQISTVPDLTIVLPQPVQIPVVDRRRRKAA
jgi:hypothetical protein